MRAAGFVGQSNEDGYGDLDQWLLLGLSLANLSYYQDDLSDSVATSGQIAALDFDPSRFDVSVGAYDYPLHQGTPSYGPYQRRIGPCVETLMAMRDHYGGVPVVGVKLSPGGTYLGDVEPFPQILLRAGWFNPASHRGWGGSPAGATFSATTVTSGAATGVAAASLTDGGASWIPDQFRGMWVTSGGAEGLVVSNTATTLFLFPPGWQRTTPAVGAYTIENRSSTTASLARVYAEQVLPAAVVAAGGPGNLDIEVFFATIGEANSMSAATAELALADALRLVWRLRNAAVTAGATTLQAHQIRFVFAEVREGTVWPFASRVNQLLRELRRDPRILVVPTQDLAVGGLTGTDQAHFALSGVRTLAARRWAAYRDALAGTDPVRRSFAAPERYEVAQPIWGSQLGGNRLRLIGSYADLLAVPTSSRLAPGAYAQTSGQPLYLDPQGFFLASERCWSGESIGCSSLQQRPGQQAAELLRQMVQARAPWAHVSVRVPPVRGSIWACGGNEWQQWDELEIVGGAAPYEHTVKIAGGSGGMVSGWSTTGGAINREWLHRGANGALGLSAALQIDEVVADTVPWMRHRITTGDYRQPQADGAGVMFLAPTIRAEVNDADLRAEGAAVGMEWYADELAPLPSGMTVQQVDHGAVAALRRVVLWPDVRLQHTLQVCWKGRPCVHRQVWSVRSPVIAGQAVQLEVGPYLMPGFDRQFAYDPAADVETDFAWAIATNRGRGISTTALTTYDSAGGVVATGASPLSRNAGIVGWRATGAIHGPADGLCVAIYAALSSATDLSARAMGRPLELRVDHQLYPDHSLAPLDSGYEERDKRNRTRLWMRFGTPDGVPAETRVALFLLVGTLAEVKSAAQSLYADGIDSTWVD